MTKQWVYGFGAGESGGDASMKALLGGKGANLAEMAKLGLPVPPGFTLTTEVCAEFYKNDRKYLETLIDLFGGGPTGVEALAATMNLATDTLSDEIEPYLLREQYIVRSPRGRVATPRGFGVLGKTPPKPKPEEKANPGLFE